MARPFSLLVALIVGIALVAGCTSTAPAPTATKAPAAPTAAAPAPTKAAAAATAAPTKPAATAAPTAPPKASWPEKGKPITMIVPYAAGNSPDLGARILVALLEKELGTPIQVVNKGGGGTMTGTADLAGAKPDGYTLMATTLWTIIGTYSDKERQATYKRSNLQPVNVYLAEPQGIAVQASGPYKTIKDLVDAAKANPGKITLGDAGLLTATHLFALLFANEVGVQFASVHFDGAGPTMTAVLGGNLDAVSVAYGNLIAPAKAGQLRILASGGRKSKFTPDVPSLVDMGYKGQGGDILYPIVAPAGIPKDVLTTLESAMKKVIEGPEYIKKIEDIQREPRFVSTAELTKIWDEVDAMMPATLEQAKSQQK